MTRKQAPEPISQTGKKRESKRARTPEEQRAEIERVAREHGADLSEEEFDEALRKVGKIMISADLATDVATQSRSTNSATQK